MIIDSAICFVTETMSGSVRKGSGAPSVLHALETGVIASTLTRDEEIIAAAILHDVIEDFAVTADTLRSRFGDRVALLVISESENKRSDMPPRESWKIRKEEALEVLRATTDMGVKILFLSDKLSNLRSLAMELEKQGESFWLKFNQNDPKEHEWYFCEVLKATEELQSSFAWRECERLIIQIFNKGE